MQSDDWQLPPIRSETDYDDWLLPPTEVQTANLRQCFFSNHLERLGSAAFHPEKNIHTSAHLENHVLHDVSNTRDAHMLPHFSTALAIFHRDRTVALSGLCDLSMSALYWNPRDAEALWSSWARTAQSLILNIKLRHFCVRCAWFALFSGSCSSGSVLQAKICQHKWLPRHVGMSRTSFQLRVQRRDILQFLPFQVSTPQ